MKTLILSAFFLFANLINTIAADSFKETSFFSTVSSNFTHIIQNELENIKNYSVIETKTLIEEEFTCVPTLTIRRDRTNYCTWRNITFIAGDDLSCPVDNVVWYVSGGSGTLLSSSNLTNGEKATIEWYDNGNYFCNCVSTVTALVQYADGSSYTLTMSIPLYVQC